jgi:thiol-disulfide isomerase/thioredoxin
MARLATALLAVLAAVTLLSACSDGADTVAAQAKQGYVAGDGAIEQIAPADRTTTISVKGKTLEGKALDSSSYRGSVVVLNTWGSWCPPCNAEAPALQRAWSGLKSQDVQFVGIDVREGPDAGLAFQRKIGVTYPSLAWDGGSVLLQLKGKATATPTTLVLDRQGRLAGRISGEARESTLTEMVQQVLDEGKGA